MRVKFFLLLSCLVLVSMACNLAQGGSSSSSDTKKENTVETRVRASRGGEVEIKNEIILSVPKNALEYDQDISIERIKSTPRGDKGTLNLLGEYYEITSEQEIFDTPLKLTLSYDEDKLPRNRNEEDIFVVFLYEGEWHRVYGDLNKRNMTISVDVLHNGYWTWAVDKEDSSVQFSWTEINEKNNFTIRSLEDAQVYKDRIQQEFNDAWYNADFAVNELKSYLNPEEVIGEIGGHIALEVADAAAIGLAGKAAVLELAGTSVAHWGGAFITGIYIGKVWGWSAIVVEKVARLKIAGDRLEEANAILWIMEHPNATTFPPEYENALERMKKGIAPGGDGTDLSACAWSENIIGTWGYTHPDRTDYMAFGVGGVGESYKIGSDGTQYDVSPFEYACLEDGSIQFSTGSIYFITVTESTFLINGDTWTRR